MPDLIQRSITPRADLREMLRIHLVKRGLAGMKRAAARRTRAAKSVVAMTTYRHTLRRAVGGLYGTLPVGANAPPPRVTAVSRSKHPGFRIENVLFDSFPGWEVNATVYVPAGDYQPPFPVVIVPVGHSGKQFANYQLPCQFFARSGYLTICFDPPGQASEKQPGNDHFNDGVRDYLIGRTSSRYFIADALRCIDYAATRADTDLRHGVAMTGVSGGGTTTTFAVHLDDRIRVIGPSCCVAPLADLDITQCYAGCPETHPFRRVALGIDEVDLVAAAAPLPCLLMAGIRDEVFHIEDTRRLAATVAGLYAAAAVADRFEFFEDAGGHGYSLEQARHFTRFMNRWLIGQPDRPVCELPDETFKLLPAEQLRCAPRTDVNMRTHAVVEADELAAEWDRAPDTVRRAAREVVGIKDAVAAAATEIGPPFQVWTHDWRALMVRPEPGIELPATFLAGRNDRPAPALLHIDDAGRHRLLHRQGVLASAIRFLDRDRPGIHLLTIDLRGWGDSAPAMYPYELAGWGGVDRYLAYASAALGDAVMAMRVRDALAALAWLRARPEIETDRIVLTASGLGGLVALHVAAIDGHLAGIVAWEGLSSFRSLLAAERYPWPADAFLPNALRYYDLPQLAAAAGCPVRLHGYRDGAGQPPGAEELAAWRDAPNATLSPDAGRATLLDSIAAMLERR